MSNLERLNEVASTLPESTIGELVDFAEFLKTKLDANVKSVVAWHEALSEEDESLSPEEAAELEAASTEVGSIPWEQAKARLGL